MLSLVSSLAEEVNSLRFSMKNGVASTGAAGGGGGAGRNVIQTQTQSSTREDKLTVSDDEEDDEGDDEDDDEDDDEVDELSESDSEDDESERENDKLYNTDAESLDDEEVEPLNISTIDISTIKILRLNMADTLENLDEPQSFDLDNPEDLEEDLEDLSIDDELDSSSVESDKGAPINLSDLKSINISSLEDLQPQPAIDYKKLSVPKLKSIVQEKGLAEDASKLKKQELLDLLEG